MKTRRKYDHEFKQMAVELSHHREDISELAEELDIKPNLLYRWTCNPNLDSRLSNNIIYTV